MGCMLSTAVLFVSGEDDGKILSKISIIVLNSVI